jgi:hypothetical protein
MLSPMWSASSGAMSPAISNAIPATIQLKCQLLKGRRGIRGSPSVVTVEAGRGGAVGLCASVRACRATAWRFCCLGDGNFAYFFVVLVAGAGSGNMWNSGLGWLQTEQEVESSNNPRRRSWHNVRTCGSRVIVMGCIPVITWGCVLGSIMEERWRA